MIQYLMLVEATAHKYRNCAGSAVKLRFDRPQGPIFSYIHSATEDDLVVWKARVGQEIPVSIRKRMLEPGRCYEEARVRFNLKGTDRDA